MSDIKVAVINSSTVLTDRQARSSVAPLQAQVDRDFAPAWGLDADLTFVPKGTKPPAGFWWLVLLDHSDSARHLGFHDMTSEGLPMGKVFAGTDIQMGCHWTATASHELLEMLADPDLHLTVLVQSTASSGVLYAHEICDPCEADAFAYRIKGTPVSDFVYPAWFESFRTEGTARFDHCQHMKRPFQLLPGGYIDTMAIGSLGGWSLKLADRGPARYRQRPALGSRRERRRTPRAQWSKSRTSP